MGRLHRYDTRRLFVYLMREVLLSRRMSCRRTSGGHQEDIRGHQGTSGDIRGHQEDIKRTSEDIRGHQSTAGDIRRTSPVIKAWWISPRSLYPVELAGVPHI